MQSNPLRSNQLWGQPRTSLKSNKGHLCDESFAQSFLTGVSVRNLINMISEVSSGTVFIMCCNLENKRVNKSEKLPNLNNFVLKSLNKI